MSLPTNPLNRKEQYLNAIATGNTVDMPTKPITREEAYLDAIAKNGGGGGGGTTNYNALDNKPQIAGTTLQGNKTLADLGIASAEALGNKVDKEAGKGLSENDYSDTEKGKVTANAEAIEAMSEYEPNDITSRLSNLSTAIAEGNLAKYGYKIGDYFDGANYRYWLGHLDYNYGGYNEHAVLGTHNIGLVVDTKSNSQWNTSNDTTGGYETCALQTYLKGTVLDNIKADLNGLFGSWSDHLIAESKLYAITPNWEWSASAEYITALTEVNVYGYASSSVDEFQQGEADQQLEIFRKYKYSRIFGNNNIWLRSVHSTSEACNAHNHGYASFTVASISLRAEGLILFY